MEWVPIREAAGRLGVSEDTVKRRLRTGALPGRKQPMGSGFRWEVEVPEAAPADPAPGGATPLEVETLRDLVGVLREQLDARTREVSELHVLLERQTRLLAAGATAGATSQSTDSAQEEGQSAPERGATVERRGLFDRLFGR